MGTARVDVTPPATAASFGHAPDSHLMEGYWTRLYCRVFVFESGSGPFETFAFVPCELAAPSNLLQRSIAEERGQEPPQHPRVAHLPHDHAHARGTGTLLREQGLRRRDQLALPGLRPADGRLPARSRIATGILSAYQARRPWRGSAGSTTTCGTSREIGRSTPTVSTSGTPTCRRRRIRRRPTSYAPSIPRSTSCRSRPPTARRPIGWMVFFAMHPTVLPATNRLFGGDAFGVDLARARARAPSHARPRAGASAAGTSRSTAAPRKDADPLVALIQTERGRHLAALQMPTGGGDRARRWRARRSRDRRPCRRQTTRRSATDRPRRALRRGRHGRRSSRPTGSASPCSGRRPRAAAAITAPPSTVCSRMRPTRTWPTAACAPKRKGMGVLQNIIVPPGRLPEARRARRRSPRHHVDLVRPRGADHHGGARRSTTTVKRDGPSAERWLVAGLANAYLQYVTTADEYQMQAYEGGSNLYGPRTLGIFQVRLRVAGRVTDGRWSRTRPRRPATSTQVNDVHFELATSVARFAATRVHGHHCRTSPPTARAASSAACRAGSLPRSAASGRTEDQDASR